MATPDHPDIPPADNGGAREASDMPPAAVPTARRWGWLLAALAAAGVVLVLLLAGGGAAWLWATESGTRWALSQVPGLSVQGLRGAAGRGNLGWQRLTLVTPAGTLQLDEVRLHGLQYRWRPAPDQWLGWSMAQADVGLLTWQSTPSSTAASAPQALRLPVAVDVTLLRVARARIDSAPELRGIQATVALGAKAGAQHRVTALRLETDRFAAQGQATLGADAPLALAATVRLDSRGQDWPWQATLEATGPLATLQARARLSGSAPAGRVAPALDARAELRPFVPWPLGDVELSTRELDLSALSSAAPRTRLRGELSLRSAGLQAPAQARIDLHNDGAARWDQGGVPVRALQAAVAGTPSPLERLDLTGLQVELGDAATAAGRLRGSGHWRQAQPPAAAASAAGPAAPQSAHLALVLAQVRPALLDQRAAPMTLSGPLTLDLSGLQAPGALRAAVSARLTGSLDGVRGPEVALTLEGEGGRNGVTVKQALATAGAARASLSGEVLRVGEVAWRWDARAELAAFDPAVWWPGEPGSPWRRGPHRLNATLSSAGQGPAAALADPLARWRELAGRAALSLAPSQLAGVPVQGDATLAGAGDASTATLRLVSGINQLTAELKPQQATATLEAPALPALAPLWALLPPSASAWVPRTGAVNVQATLAGTLAQPRWRLQARGSGLQSAQGSLNKVALEARGEIGTGPLNLDAPLTLSLNGEGLVAGGGRLDTLRATLEGSPRRHQISLQAESPLRPPLWFEQLLGARTGSGTRFQASVDGAWQPAGGGRGTSAPTATGAGRAGLPMPARAAGALAGQWRAQVRELQGGARDGSGQAWLAGKDLVLRADFGAGAALQGFSAEPGRLILPGTALSWREARWQPGAGAAGLPRMQVDAQIEPFALAPLLARAQPELGWRGDLMLAGSVKISSEQRFDADIVFERQSGDLSVADDAGSPTTRVQSLNLSDLRLGLAAHDGVWHFTQGLAGRQLGEMAGVATVRTRSDVAWPPADAPLDGVLQLHVATLGAWGAWVPPGWRLGGELTVAAKLGGRFGAPNLTGRVSGQQLSVRNALEGVQLTDGQVEIVMEGERARVERFEFKGGGGTLSLTGDATAGAKPQAVLTGRAERFQVLNRVDRQLMISGDATLRLTAEQLAVEGQFKVDEGLIDFSRGGAPGLDDDVSIVNSATAKADAGADAEASRPAAKRNNVLNVKLDLGNKLRVKGRGLDTGLQGELKVATSATGRLGVTGAVRTERGTYAAYGQKLNIERGVLTFIGPVEDPRLDIFASRPNLDVTVGVTVTGSALNPRVRLSSEPEMADIDKLSWLVLGRASDGLGRADTALLQRAAVALLAGEGEAPTDAFLNSIGITDFGVRQDEVGDTRETVVSVGKQLSRRWYLGYERSVNAATGTWQLIYRAAQRFTLRAQSGDDNALDLIWTWRWN